MKRPLGKSTALSRWDTRRQLGKAPRIKRDKRVDTTKGGMPWPPRREDRT